MNDKKQIEELASLMADCSTTCDECFEKFERVMSMTIPIQKRKNYCQVYAYAQKAVEQGYQKIPEGAVILTKEECDNKVILDEDHFERVLNNVRKDTAKKFAEKLKKYLYNSYNSEDISYEEFCKANVIFGDIDKLLEEYEVKNDKTRTN